MRLIDLLDENDIIEIIGDRYIKTNNLADNSNYVTKGDLFFAKIGSTEDSHKFIDSAIKNGATAIVCEVLPQNLHENVCYVKVKNSKIALAKAAKIFYDDPSSRLKLIAVTGTCGKTSSVYILYQTFKNLGYRVGILSSIENKTHLESYKSDLTTPGVLSISKLLAQMVDEGCEYCFMEASSHAIDQHRIYGLSFIGAVFTNISHEHLDYHKTFNNYIYAKKKLFDNLDKKAFALVNIDDRNASIMLQNCVAKKKFFSLNSISDYRCRVISNNFDGIELSIDDNPSVWINLRGKFNAYNILAAYSVANILGQDREETLIALSKIDSVPGRFQVYKNKKGIIGVIDHAHKPDALQNLLLAVKNLSLGRQKIVTVFGCGGNRDREKRPLMGKIAAELSDYVIISSDNPRFENAEDIIDEIYLGVPHSLRPKVQKIADREAAIQRACYMCEADDILIMAGKGDEKYVLIEGQKIPFDELQIFMS